LRATLTQGFNHETLIPAARAGVALRPVRNRHASLPEGTTIGYDADSDRARYSVSDGGVVVVVRAESMLEEPE